MTAATTTDTGLDWVTFEDHDHTRSCDYRSDPCSRQATHAGIFRLVAGDCEHFRTRILYCLAHRDLILAQAKENGRLFCCPTCKEHTIVQLIRMVTL